MNIQYKKQQGVTLTAPVSLDKLKETKEVLDKAITKAKTMGEFYLSIGAKIYKKSLNP